MIESIWYNKQIRLEDFPNKNHTDHIAFFLGIEFTEIGPDFIKATMPVNERTRQPFGILHGGSSLVLAESIGSVASALVINRDEFLPVGLEINANHLRPVKEGLITAICSPIQLGKTIHVWDIKMYNSENKMNCISRLTVSIIPLSKVSGL